MERIYPYVGPEAIRRRVQDLPPGEPITSPTELLGWVRRTCPGTRELIVTYTVDAHGVLHLADRHSEHVACAAGQPVRGAGELGLEIQGDQIEIVYLSNQSTGYCPEPGCFGAVAECLRTAGLEPPAALSAAFEFRRCPGCGCINLIKEGWLYCACGAPLPERYNL